MTSDEVISGLEAAVRDPDVSVRYSGVFMEAMRLLRPRHDSLCESELTSHGYTACRCDKRHRSQS